MPFYTKNDKIIGPTLCPNCQCKDDENTDCQCVCDDEDSPNGNQGPRPPDPDIGSALPPYVHYCSPCILYARYGVKCPTQSEECMCLPPTCYFFDAAIVKGHDLKVKDLCECPDDPNGEQSGQGEYDCVDLAEEPDENGVVGHTKCGGTVYKISPDFCTQAELDKWKEDNLPQAEEDVCCVPTGYFIGVVEAKDEENHEDDPCYIESPKACCEFEAEIYSGKICPGSVCDIPVDCMDAGGSYEDPETGDTVRVTMISPDELCGQDYYDWYATASEPGGEIEQKREEICGDGGRAKWIIEQYKFNQISANSTNPPPPEAVELQVCKTNCAGEETCTSVASFNIWTLGFEGCCEVIAAREEAHIKQREALNKEADKIGDVKSYEKCSELESGGSGCETSYSTGSYNKIRVEKSDDYKGEASGVIVCVTTRTVDKCSGEEKVEKSKRTLKWGDVIEGPTGGTGPRWEIKDIDQLCAGPCEMTEWGWQPTIDMGDTPRKGREVYRTEGCPLNVEIRVSVLKYSFDEQG